MTQALNREQILNAEFDGQLAEQYVVEAMQHRHQAAVLSKRLELALDANDALHAEIEELKAAAESGKPEAAKAKAKAAAAS